MFQAEKNHEHSQIKSDMANLSPALDSFYEKDVVSLAADDTVADAAKLMLEKHIGNIVITESQDGKTVPVGIVTDRDIVINAVAKKLDPETLKLSDVMSKEIATADEIANLSDLIQLMTSKGISRLPIVGSDGTLKGILTSKKLFQYFAQGLCELSSLSVQQHAHEGASH